MKRLRIYLEPRDAWIGAYVAPKAVYVCPLPFLVIRWERNRWWCTYCGNEIEPLERLASGYAWSWTHTGKWQGRRCPGDLTGAFPAAEREPA